jgi:hypothetical protein
MTAYRIVANDGYVYNHGTWTVPDARGQVFASMTSACLTMLQNHLIECGVEATDLSADCPTCGGTGFGVNPDSTPDDLDMWCKDCHGTGRDDGSA